MTVLSARVFFEQIVPQVIASRAERGLLPQATVSFQVVGDDGGSWTLRLRGKEGSVGEELAADAALRFIVADRAFEELLAGKLDPERAFRSRAVSIEGDWSLLEQVAFLFTPPGRAWDRY